MANLIIQNLFVHVNEKEVLQAINLTIKPHEIHVILGPNGVGKTSLCQAIMGNPIYQITKGSLQFDDQDITNLPINERSQKGIFLAWQNPLPFDGLVISEFLRTVLHSQGQHPNVVQFGLGLNKALRELKLPESTAFKYLNHDFSGGEKKKLEILQLKILKPKLALLDEIDSGLDVDSLEVVCHNIREQLANTDLSLLIITHTPKILTYLQPTHCHVLLDGKIVKTGDASLADEVLAKGFDYLR